MIFAKSINVSDDPHAFYVKILIEFQKLLELAHLSTRKEDGVFKRRKITFHSFRRFCKTTISNQLSADYSEWYLGHRGSSYWRVKNEDKRKMYKDSCMKYLTFLDYPSIQAESASIEARLSVRIKELEEQVRQKDKEASQREVAKQSEANETTKAIADLMNTVKQLEKKVNDMGNK